MIAKISRNCDNVFLQMLQMIEVYYVIFTISTSDGRARSIKISKPNFWHRNQKSLSLIFSSSTEPHQEFLIPAIGFALYWISVKFSSKERKRKDLKREADYQDYKVGGRAADSKWRSFNFFSPCHLLSVFRISHKMLRPSVTLYI